MRNNCLWYTSVAMVNKIGIVFGNLIQSQRKDNFLQHYNKQVTYIIVNKHTRLLTRQSRINFANFATVQGEQRNVNTIGMSRTSLSTIVFTHRQTDNIYSPKCNLVTGITETCRTECLTHKGHLMLVL